MVVNFEFLGEEPIENVMTCMHFQIDKVVFFGYQDMVDAQKDRTVNFLKEYCGVSDIVFHAVSRKDIQSVLKTLRKAVELELSQKNQLYFDITGGESLLLVAMGILSKEYETPMHIYDIWEDQLVEFEEHPQHLLSQNVPTKRVEWNLDTYIKMWGGVINERMHKMEKDIPDAEAEEDVVNIWNVVKENKDIWNDFSRFAREQLRPGEGLEVNKRAASVVAELRETGTDFHTPKQLNDLLDALGNAGILLHVVHSNGRYQFCYKNEYVKKCLWGGGNVWEQFTYLELKEQCDDCRVGVYLDWDGIIHEQVGRDVLNEIDVLTLKGNIPTFISCKTGKMTGNASLHALYELETVAERFGGKYAKKILKTAQPLNEVYRERAAEMGIVVEE